MPSSRIPWWIWLIAASFIACFVVGFLYLPFKLPEATGFTLSFRENRVAGVTPGSPADAAGVKPGDRIVSLDGRAVNHIVELGGALSSTAFDHPVSLVVLRGGQEVHLQLTLHRTLTKASPRKNTWAGGWNSRSA